MDSPKLFLPYLAPWDADGARERFEKGDGHGFAYHGYSKGIMLDIVAWNQRQLIDRGIYEAALITAFTGCKHNNRFVDARMIERMFQDADRTKLRAAGDPLPGPGPFTVYRGVSGRTSARRVRGMSWTDDLDKACWFSTRYNGHDPGVYTATVTADMVYAYLNDRNESEFIVRPIKYRRLPLTAVELKAVEDRRQLEQHQKWLASQTAVAVAGDGTLSTADLVI